MFSFLSLVFSFLLLNCLFVLRRNKIVKICAIICTQPRYFQYEITNKCWWVTIIKMNLRIFSTVQIYLVCSWHWKKNSVYSVHELASFPIRQCRHVCLPCACVRSMNIQMFKKYEKHLNIQKNVLNAKYSAKDRCLYVSLCFVLTFSSYSRFPLSIPSDAHMCMCVCFCLKPLTENKF